MVATLAEPPIPVQRVSQPTIGFASASQALCNTLLRVKTGCGRWAQ
jgi:hypothetical protein